jgi:hypothetical protein
MQVSSINWFVRAINCTYYVHHAITACASVRDSISTPRLPIELLDGIAHSVDLLISKL